MMHDQTQIKFTCELSSSITENLLWPVTILVK